MATHHQRRLWVAGCRVPSGTVYVDVDGEPRRVVVGAAPGPGEIHLDELVLRQRPGQRLPTTIGLVDGSVLTVELDPANALGRRGQRGFDPWKVDQDRRGAYVATVLASLPVGADGIRGLIDEAIEVAFFLDSARARLAALPHLVADQDRLLLIARGDDDPRVRVEALARMADPGRLLELAAEPELVAGPGGEDLRAVAAARLGRERHREALIRSAVGRPDRYEAAFAALAAMCSLPRLDLLAAEAAAAADAAVAAAVAERARLVRDIGLHPEPLSALRAAHVLAEIGRHVAATVPAGRAHDQARRRETRRAARRLAREVRDPGVGLLLGDHPDPVIAVAFSDLRPEPARWRVGQVVQGVVDDLTDFAEAGGDRGLPVIGAGGVDRAARLYAEAAPHPELLHAYTGSSHPVLAAAARRRLAELGQPTRW